MFKHTTRGDGVIEFKKGINYIFGKKDSRDDPTESLNGIGKSLLLDLVDFCLLASFSKTGNPRLYEAKEHVSGYQIILEFEIDDTLYVIKRSADQPNRVDFGTTDNVITYEKINELSPFLCDLIFKAPGYPGYYENNLLRKLLPFFIKIHKTKQSRFADPIEYIKGCNPTELNRYHLFLLGIDNSLANENHVIQESLKAKEPALKEIKKNVIDRYQLRKISDMDSEIANLQREIEKFDRAIETFKLAEQYKDVEKQANALTAEIKKNIYLNFMDSKTIRQYRESYEKKDGLINLRQIENIYKELDNFLAGRIKVELTDAVDFRKKLADSREEFLAGEIQDLEEKIKERSAVINRQEDERARLFEFLEVKEAIKDLTEAMYQANEKKKQKAELETNYGFYKNLDNEISRLKTAESQLQERINYFIDEISEAVSAIREIFARVYNHTYTEAKDKSIFTISKDNQKKQKICIDVGMPAMHSKGKNQGRTLIYDITVLLHAIEKGIRGPRFLIHDSIFDGMDKAHFVAITNFLNAEMRAGKNFQYIIPINEEGTLSDKFGVIDEVNPDKIEEEAILVLTPTKKLLGKTWK